MTRIYDRIREALDHGTEREAGQRTGESKRDTAEFGGKRNGHRGRTPAGQSVGCGRLTRDGRVDPTVVASGSADAWLRHLQAPTRTGSVSCTTDAVRGDPSLKRYGHQHPGSPAQPLVSRRMQRPIKGLEGFGRYVKHLLDQDRGVSKSPCPMSLKAVESRLHHRQENVFKQFLKSYFVFDSP